MRAKTSLAIGLLALAPGALWLVACSGGDTNTNPEGGTDATVDTGTGTDTGIGMDTGNNMDTGTGGGSCGDAGSRAACSACCGNAHKAGEAVWVNAIQTCVCRGNDGGSRCQQCNNNFCGPDGGTQPSMPCQQCAALTLSPDGGPCLAPLAAACSGSPDCQAYYACIAKCP